MLIMCLKCKLEFPVCISASDLQLPQHIQDWTTDTGKGKAGEDFSGRQNEKRSDYSVAEG